MVVRPYWTFRYEIFIEDSLLFKGHRIIIQESFQSDILSKLHIEKTKLRARTSVFWRNLNRDIEEVTKACKICQEFQTKQAREPLIPSGVPSRPWHMIGTDLFYFSGNEISHSC